jgi:hypothetical protein
MCMVYGVWCMVYGVWCMYVYGVCVWCMCMCMFFCVCAFVRDMCTLCICLSTRAIDNRLRLRVLNHSCLHAGGGPSAHIPLLEGLVSGDASLLLRRAANAIYGNACFIVPNPRVRIRRGSAGYYSSALRSACTPHAFPPNLAPSILSSRQRAGSPTEVYVDAIPQGNTQVMRGAVAEAVGDCASLPATTNGANGAMRLVLRYSR